METLVAMIKLIIIEIRYTAVMVHVYSIIK